MPLNAFSLSVTACVTITVDGSGAASVGSTVGWARCIVSDWALVATISNAFWICMCNSYINRNDSMLSFNMNYEWTDLSCTNALNWQSIPGMIKGGLKPAVWFSQLKLDIVNYAHIKLLANKTVSLVISIFHLTLLNLVFYNELNYW